MRIWRFTIGILAAVFFVAGFQNCSNVSFVTDQENLGAEGGNSALAPPSNGPVTFPGRDNVDGITGGHFDLDTSTAIYSAGAGTTNHHEHEYDKKHQTTILDFFNLLDSDFDYIQRTIAPDTRFVLNVVNASLSPGAVLEINGFAVPVTSFRRGQIFTLGPVRTAGDVSLTRFRMGFSPNIIAQGGLVPTATSCVRANDPGKNGEYRNGALTIQALNASNFSIDQATGAASSGLLWEATVFWHKDSGCN